MSTHYFKTTLADLLLPAAAALSNNSHFAAPLARLVRALIPYADGPTTLAVLGQLSVDKTIEKDMRDGWGIIADAMLKDDAKIAMPEIIKGLSHTATRPQAYKRIVTAAIKADFNTGRCYLVQAKAYMHMIGNASDDRGTIQGFDLALKALNAKTIEPG